MNFKYRATFSCEMDITIFANITEAIIKTDMSLSFCDKILRKYYLGLTYL